MSLPFVTGDLPGGGGLVKATPEDFVVEEVPAYLPSGEGAHLFLWVEKTGKETREVAAALADALGVSEREVGYAGMKDRQGRTRQFFSVPAAAEGRLGRFSLPGVTVLEARRHPNKLRTGHLRGNRFQLLLRDVKDAAAAAAVFEALKARGVPNYFGDQRFGREGDNAQKGKALIRGLRLDRAPSAFQRKLYLSAYQSLLFNRALAHRVEEGTFARAQRGDVMRKADSGGLFVCEAPEVDQPRVDAFEISPAGPLFGPKMPKAADDVARVEAQLLEEEGVTVDDFRRGRGETLGGRRAYRISLGDPKLEAEGQDVRVAFTLPRGSYATVVLREMTRA